MAPSQAGAERDNAESFDLPSFQIVAERFRRLRDTQGLCREVPGGVLLRHPTVVWLWVRWTHRAAPSYWLIQGK